jgi:hypothetical protein
VTCLDAAAVLRLLPSHLFAFVLFAAFAFVVGCGGASASETDGVREAGPILCSEASPTEARLAFPDGEIGALAVANGELFIGARSLRVDEEGALWRVAFDGRPARQLSRGYIGGPIHVIGDRVLHAEPIDAAANGRLVVTSFDGTRRAVEGPSLVLGEFDVVRDQAFFFGRQTNDDAIALWSYDPSDPNATVVHVANATGGGLFSNGAELLQAAVDGDVDATPRVVHVRRFEGATGTFADVTSFPVFERGIVGADADALYLHDEPTRSLLVVDLRSGREIRTLARDLDMQGGAHVTDDAIYSFETSTRELVRIDKSSGAREVVASLKESAFIHAFASDACYVYAAIDGARTIARIPR